MRKSFSFIIIFCLFLPANCMLEQAKVDRVEKSKIKKADASSPVAKKIKEMPKETKPVIRVDSLYKDWISPVNIDYSKYEKRSGIEIVLQSSHTDRVNDLRVSPDGRLFITSSEDRTIKIWSIDGKLLKTIPVPDTHVNCIIFSPNGKTFIACLEDKSIEIRDLDGSLIKRFKGKEYHAECLAISPDGETIVTSAGYRTVDIRDKDWKIKKTVEASYHKVRSLAFSPDGKTFVSGGSHTKTKEGWRSASRMWSKDGDFIKELDALIPASIALTSSNKKQIDTGEVVWVSFSNDGKYIATAGEKSVVNIRSKDGDLLLSLKASFPRRCFFSADSRSITVIGSDEINIFNMNGEKVNKIGIRSKTERENSVECSAITPDGRWIITGFFYPRNGIIRIFDRNGNMIKNIYDNGIKTTSVALSPDLRRLIFELKPGKKSVIWNVDRNYIENADESIGFYNNGEEYRFTNDRGVFNIWKKDLRQSFKFTFSHMLVPLGNGNIALPQKGNITIYKIDGAPLRKFEYEQRTGGSGDIVFSPDASFFIAQTMTYNGSVHEISVFNMDGKVTNKFRLDSKLTTYNISPDGKHIASGHENGDIQIWTRDGRNIRKLKAHFVKINALAFGPDMRYLASSSDDRTTKIWNMKTWECITLKAFETGDWVIFDEKGHFDCSDGGREYVSFVKGLTSYNFQQFWNDFFTPGIISNFIEGREAKGINIANEINNAPDVSIRHEKGFAANEETATVTVCATPKNNGVGRIFLSHNGRGLDESSRGLSVVAKGSCREFKISLTPGENTITGAAYDRDNRVFGQSERISVAYTPAKIIKPDMFVLSVGVSNYKDKNISLESPERDALAVSQAIKYAGEELYGNIYTYILTEREATKNGIKTQMDKLSALAKKADAVILFFAGHGDIENGIYYYLPYDADITDLKNTCISINDISRSAQTLSANKIAIFFDTCKSGGATASLSTIALARGYDDRKIIANLAKERGIAVFSAASSTQAAYEIKALKHGIFTFSLLDALKNRTNDISNGSLISIAKLLSIVGRSTRDTAYKYLNVEQSPILYMFGDDFSIGIVK